MNNKTKKQELVVVATKYKNQPIKIDYYTKSGESISKNSVIREKNSSGAKFFHFL